MAGSIFQTMWWLIYAIIIAASAGIFYMINYFAKWNWGVVMTLIGMVVGVVISAIMYYTMYPAE